MTSLSCPLPLASAPSLVFLPSSSSVQRNIGMQAFPMAFLDPNGRNLSVRAFFGLKEEPEYPWPRLVVPVVDTSEALSHISHFKPLEEKRKSNVMEFEKPVKEFEEKLAKFQVKAAELGVDIEDQIVSFKIQYQKVLKHLCKHLTPMQRLSIARHSCRPTFLDHMLNITDTWVELHGDRSGYDDPAIVTGLGSIDGKTYVFIGEQKGRTTKESVQRNFGMPTPQGYRKALKMMQYAVNHGLPIITFVDTPGAFADPQSERLGQGEAIARNLQTMFGLEVPIVTVIIGEGSSGGALAIACANKILMMENAVFYVASPEACAAILWKDSKLAFKAARKSKITANDMCTLKLADAVIPEPPGGAHNDPKGASREIKAAIMKAMEELSAMDVPELLEQRRLKFRNIGNGEEILLWNSKMRPNMKRGDSEEPSLASELSEKVEKLKELACHSKGDLISQSVEADVDNTLSLLKKEVDKELHMIFQIPAIKRKVARLSRAQQVIHISMKKEIILSLGFLKIFSRWIEIFSRKIESDPNFSSYQHKLGMLKDVAGIKELILKEKRDDLLKQKVSNSFKAVLGPEIVKKLEILNMDLSSAGITEMVENSRKEIHDELLKSSTLIQTVGEGHEKRDDLLEQKVSNNLKAIPGVEIGKKVEILETSLLNAGFTERIENLRKEIHDALLKSSMLIQTEEGHADVSDDLKAQVEEFNREAIERFNEALNEGGLRRKMAWLKILVRHENRKQYKKNTNMVKELKLAIKWELLHSLRSTNLVEKQKKIMEKMAKS